MRKTNLQCSNGHHGVEGDGAFAYGFEVDDISKKFAVGWSIEFTEVTIAIHNPRSKQPVIGLAMFKYYLKFKQECLSDVN